MATKSKTVPRDLRHTLVKVDQRIPPSPTKPGALNNGSTLYYGDNLSVLREHIKDESVDLVYLDPPFNSSATYNVLFSTPKGHQSGAQIEAFEDTWHWGEQTEQEFSDILNQPNTQVAEVLRALRQFLGENDMMAYLVMIANRLLDLHRVLKPHGSLYLHCDPTASHYLKLLLDGVFGAENFVNEISWHRTTAKADYAQGATHYPRVRDVIFFVGKSFKAGHRFHQQFLAYDVEYIASKYRNKDTDGRAYRLDNLTGPGGAANGNPSYEVMGVTRYWRYSKVRMAELIKNGRVVQTKIGGVPQYKRYLDEMPGVPVSDDWSDIRPINSQAEERLGYPTQKPQALLERIISTSSDDGDVILDPFCGCGTAVHAAQKLGRRWIGIDVTHLAISLVEKRLADAYPGIVFEVHGTPQDFDGAKDLAARDKYQFQWWACSLVNSQPYGGKKKGADGGIDGLIFFKDDKGLSKKIIVSVKGGENVGVTMVKDLIATVARQRAELGLFVTLTAPTKPMITEAASAGLYKSPTGATFPKIQILEIEKLLSGIQSARYPNLDAGALTFKKAKVEQGPDTQGYMFDVPPQKAKKKASK